MNNLRQKIIFYQSLGESLRLLRVEKGYSLPSLAQACELNEQTLRQYEQGEEEMGVYALHVLTAALGCELPVFLENALARFRQQRLLSFAEPSTPFDHEAQEAGELIRHFFTVEGSGRGDKFKHLVSELRNEKKKTD